MPHRFLSICTLIAAVVFIGSLLRADDPPAAKNTKKTPQKTHQAWTFDEALKQLRLNPDDVYLQYVVMQLARNENKADEAAKALDRLNRRRGWGPDRRVDLFSLFTGALAVQESLQLDTMRGDPDNRIGLAGKPAENAVKVADLEGPTVKSHPWGKMLAAQQLAGKKPQVSPLALCVPEDQYFVLFRSVDKLLEGIDASDLWGAHLFSQAAHSATTRQTTKRLKRQLAVEIDPLTRPFYDTVVEEMAITGSDLYFREGSDVTLVFLLKQPKVFKLRMDGFLTAAEKLRPDAARTTGKIQGIDYVQVSTPDRAVHVFSAYPKPNLHVRSNSKVAMDRVLRAIIGNKGIRRLGDSTELKYIRTLMVRGDEREDGFIYLSDPFIRRLVGPELKLTERRRMLAYNYLRMIGHAAMLYRTQFGRKPESLEQLAETGCAPDVFGQGKLRCPAGGTYRLSADGTTGVSSIYGHARSLVPCCEVPVTHVTEAEAKEYKKFVQRYSRYWQKFFDPIAIRVQITPKQYRAETIILPLLDNSVYTGMAMALGGEPEPLDAMPVPERNIFSMVLRLNKQYLLKEQWLTQGLLGQLKRKGIELPAGGVSIEEFLARGIGNQIGMHVYDASPMFDFDLTGFLGEVLDRFRGGGGFGNEIMLPISFLIASLNSPVYLAAPVQDAEIVDKFLDQLDTTLAQLARQPQRHNWDLGYDFYRVPLEGPLKDADKRIRCYNMSFGPVKLRMFFARIGDGLYVASKRFILEDLAAMQQAKAKNADNGPTAHAMVRIRPEHWNQVLPTFRLGWAESARVTCLDNLGPLSNVARAMRASGDGKLTANQVLRQAELLYATRCFCPGGGRYVLSPDRTHVTCSVHGTATAPRQPAAPPAGSPMGRLMKGFGGLTAELTFLEDGLHAVVTVDRLSVNTAVSSESRADDVPKLKTIENIIKSIKVLKTGETPQPTDSFDPNSEWWMKGDKACPEGTVLKGAPPPKNLNKNEWTLGLEAAYHVWCEKPDGTKHGRWTAWLANGRKSCEGEHRNGQSCGRWTWWDRNGKISAIKEYNDEGIIKSVKYNEDGTLLSQTLFGEGSHKRKLQEYNHGKLVKTTEFEKGKPLIKRVGDMTVYQGQDYIKSITFYGKDGKITKVEVYQQGKFLKTTGIDR